MSLFRILTGDTSPPQGPSDWANQYVNKTQWADKNVGHIGDFERPLIAPPGGVGGIKCLPKIATFSNKHTLLKTFARYVPAGEGGSVAASDSFKINVYTPSNRLRIAVYVVFEPDTTNLDVSYQAGNENIWSITSMSRNPNTGKETSLQNAYPNSGTKNLPDAYEADSAVELLRVNVTLKHNAFAVAYVAATERVNCNIIVTWEPNTPMTQEQFFELCARCDVSTSGIPKLIQNDAV